MKGAEREKSRSASRLRERAKRETGEKMGLAEGQEKNTPVERKRGQMRPEWREKGTVTADEQRIGGSGASKKTKGARCRGKTSARK